MLLLISKRLFFLKRIIVSNSVEYPSSLLNALKSSRVLNPEKEKTSVRSWSCKMNGGIINKPINIIQTNV